MNTAIFNTLEYAKKLESAGFSAGQAELQARVLGEFAVHHLTNHATKKDLDELSQNTKRDLELHAKTNKHDLEQLALSMRHELSEHRQETKHALETLQWMLTIRLGSMLVVGIGILAVLIKL